MVEWLGVGPASSPKTLGTRHKIECAMVIPMVIQSTRVLPSRPDQIDAAPNVSRQDPSGADQSDAEHLARNRKAAV
jgi:hypothetical protein